MADPDSSDPSPRPVWPRFVLAALLLGAAAAVLWVVAEVKHVRQRKAFQHLFERAPAPPSTERLEQWRAELAGLATNESDAATAALAKWLDKLQGRRLPVEIQLEVLEAAGKREAPAVKLRLQRYLASLPKEEPLAPYRDLLRGGNAATGRKIFLEKPEANCGKCHRIAETGPEIGPPLNGIGAKQSREEILESILFPNAKITKGYESVILLLKNGSAVCGVLRRETPTELTVDSAEDGVTIVKTADVQSRRAAMSPMPEGLWAVLSRRDLRDLVEFLATLK
jgi:quinoprotein glucose dehydrogenase